MSEPLRARALASPPEPRYPPRSKGVMAIGATAAALLLPGCGLLWTLVAPVFEHGLGIGSWGCIVVASPVFLSEDDAMEVLRDELEAAGYTGIQEGSDCPTYLANRISVHAMRTVEAEGAVQGDHLDLCVPNDDFGLEYVSYDDSVRLATWPIPLTSAGSTPDTLLVARYLTGEVSTGLQPGTRYAGLLYDPVETRDTADDSGQPWDEAALERAREQLRLQIRDFIAWLQDQPGTRVSVY